MSVQELYKTSDGRYGEYKATDGNKLVLKMQETGGYEAFLESEVTKVMPYTIDVFYLNTSKTYSYLGTENQVAVGDVLLSEQNTIARVIAVDSKNENATKRFEGVKLVTEKIS